MKRSRLKPEFPAPDWSTEQDCFLIENSALPIELLILNLPFSEEEIRARKTVLGLVRRQRQMNRM
ncbi:hypothetical protein LF296_08540 [Acinetobacter vivianii]|jgi:hypothetical protein|uniref:Acyl-CoA thioesterase n=1 Tax=Acinetobacter vivianii TaxID=1776742 RepID=A0AAJ6NLY4_9GAMM|nr:MULTISPECIES: hypothetical protein [Acinetobacter]MEB6478824.1 hypothetical protein [Acinetobacter vivianii]MEB6657345.1 hypothetical protein [Acinetobacter vivianii]OEC92329.1 hypothetical protein A9Z07_01925 [Acinetobacter sp. YK3]WDZ52811.1 hypothetical protein LF296_08540 [Acinetobacter vivianii]